MYRGRQRGRFGGNDRQQQQAEDQSSAQHANTPNVNVEEWQDPSVYYPHAHFIGDTGMPANFPVGTTYNQELGWMEPFGGTPGDINEQATSNLAPYQQYGENLQRTASAPVGSPRPPVLRSQGSQMETPGDYSSRQAFTMPSEAGQPGSSAAAASAESTRRSTSSARYSSRPRLEEENRLLLDLRDRQRLPWREVTRQFEQTYSREYRMPTLQMRYGRLRQSSQASRQRQWTDVDTEALRQACQWYHDERWRIVSERMQQLGASEQWTAEECEAAWLQLIGESRSSSGATAGSRGGGS